MFTKKLFWVLVFGFMNLVSVDAKERSYMTKINDQPLNIGQNFSRRAKLKIHRFSLSVRIKSIQIVRNTF